MFEAAPESYVGRQFGDYKVTGVLAIGGIGRVLRAVHDSHGGEVAIKVLAGGLLEDTEAIERFGREAHLIEQISHPGLVKIHQHAFTPEGLPYLVMELLEGEPLNFRLERMGKLPEKMAIDVAQQLAATLAAVHAAGVVHRDLKPGNIFIVPGPDGAERVKLFDFGIAKAFTMGGLTRTGTVMGTPVYLAPEQCLDAKHVDHRADIYAFGVILYEMLSGEPPFTGGASGGLREILRQQLNDPPPKLNVNRHLSDVVMRCLRKGPEHRFPAMDAVVEALGALDRLNAAARIELDPTVKQKTARAAASETEAQAAPAAGPRSAGMPTAVLRNAPTQILSRGNAPATKPRAAAGPPRRSRWLTWLLVTLLLLAALAGAWVRWGHARWGHLLPPAVTRAINAAAASPARPAAPAPASGRSGG